MNYFKWRIKGELANVLYVFERVFQVLSVDGS